MTGSQLACKTLLLILLVTSGCGRKQRNIFSFRQEEEPVKTSAFNFPAPRSIEITKTEHGIIIKWLPPHFSNIQREIFLGYNVYRLNAAGFIPKKPLNQVPLTQTTFLDQEQSETHASFYLIKAVFKVNTKTIEGLTGQIKGG